MSHRPLRLSPDRVAPDAAGRKGLFRLRPFLSLPRTRLARRLLPEDQAAFALGQAAEFRWTELPRGTLYRLEVQTI